MTAQRATILCLASFAAGIAAFFAAAYRWLDRELA